ncbi:HigA family addiction module antidote protein [Limnothrix sp. FACHB-708]|nr:HigA family addiction module antidote protein [Limnothrix sp. FACHB-708]MBD2590610.1 HigA family addiction module antidote protein [Limnothrix sp. FACHB-406]
MMEINQQNFIHPGEVLLEDFLRPLKISYTKLAAETGISVRVIGAIARGKRSISPEVALRLSRYFGLSERFWLNLQIHYDLETLKQTLRDHLETEVKIFAPTSGN